MLKTCRNCKKTFNSKRSTGETPDTIFCPLCSRKFKAVRREWNREVELSDRSNVLPNIRRGVGDGRKDRWDLWVWGRKWI